MKKTRNCAHHQQYQTKRWRELGKEMWKRMWCFGKNLFTFITKYRRKRGKLWEKEIDYTTDKKHIIILHTSSHMKSTSCSLAQCAFCGDIKQLNNYVTMRHSAHYSRLWTLCDCTVGSSRAAVVRHYRLISCSIFLFYFRSSIVLAVSLLLSICDVAFTRIWSRWSVRYCCIIRSQWKNIGKIEKNKDLPHLSNGRNLR